ncbi:MAG TPA: carboxypeptidase-like regulatory domain-containing protein, partial [Pyrinomonadaceae bacterium]|nr:carboxypeptidase-like regulatory domain-containing protein [Pyrinomonadaceae bacterium]
PRLSPTNVVVLGDGTLGIADGTAIDAYARQDKTTDFDPNTGAWDPTPAGGNATITNLGPNCTSPTAPESDAKITPESEAAAAARVVRVVSRSGSRNSDITVDIEMTAQGNEAGTQYGLHFDPSVLSISSISGVNANPDIALGAGAPAGTTLNVNADDAANGNIGIVENFSAAAITALPEGAIRIARVRFHVLDGAASGTSRVDFDNSVINGITSDVNGMVLSANYEGGDVSVSSSRGLTVSGRVTSSDGRGIRGATVTLVDGDGLAMTTTTSSFGYYTFDDVAAATYTIAVSSRQYRFGSRTITVGDSLADIDFMGSE